MVTSPLDIQHIFLNWSLIIKYSLVSFQERWNQQGHLEESKRFVENNQLEGVKKNQTKFENTWDNNKYCLTLNNMQLSEI